MAGYLKKSMAAALAAAMLLAFAGCVPPQAKEPDTQQERFQASFLTLFNTVTTIVGYADSKEAFLADAQFIHDELEVYHQLYDIYNDYDGVNNMKTINDSAGLVPVAVDRKIIDLLREAKAMNEFTGGKVNVAMGSVLSIWHTYREEGINDPAAAELPPMADLRQAAEHTDIDDVIIDETNNTVYLSDPDMSLDVGAIAKGYATQAACNAAREKGITSLLLSVGGNVCAVGGQDGGEKPWKIGVQNPSDPDSTDYLHTMRLTNQTLVTSGSYQRYYTVGGKEYHHIIDPNTLMPANYFAAVTVLSEDSGTADAMSTALYNLPYEEGLERIESLGGAEAMWIMKDGTMQYTPGFLDYAEQ